LNNTLQKGLKERIPPSLVSQLTSSGFSLRSANLSEDEKQLILSVYVKGIQYIFISYAAFIGLCFLSSLFVEDHGVAEKDHEPGP
jgi:hypothetical protein